jgi:hypothetical protein
VTKFKGLRIDVLCLIAVLISQTILIYQEFGRYLPITDGWYVGLTRATKSAVLYKDVYFPFPPGTYFFEGYLPSLFKNPMFGEQVIHSISWMLLSLFFYLILRYIFPNIIAAVVSITVLSIYFSQPGNIISGYFELMYLFFFAGAALLLWSTEGEKRLHHSLLFFGTLCLAISVTVKQTALLPVLLVIFYYLKLKWKLRKDVLPINFGLIFAGVCIPCAVVLTWAIKNQTFFQMIQSMLGGGKDVGGLSVITTAGSNMLPNISVASALFLLAVFIILQLKNQGYVFNVATLILSWCAFMQFSGFGPFDQWQQSPILGFYLVASVFWLVHMVSQQHSDRLKTRPTESFDSNSLLVATLLLSMSAFLGICVTRLRGSSGNLSPNLQAWFSDLSALISNNLVICGAVSVAGLYIATKFNITLFLKSYEQKRIKIASGFFLTSTIAFYIMNSFAGGIGVEVFAINIALVLGIFLYSVQTRHGNSALIAFVLAFLIPWTVSASVFHVNHPYSWFGITEKALNTPRKTPKAPGLSSFSLSVQSADDYDLLYDGVIAAGEIINKDRISVLLGPRNIGLSSMFNLETYALHCPILWWDMCPEKYALGDYEQIQHSPPSLVIWSFEPQSTITSNENGWRRQSTSAVGMIQSWLSQKIGNGYYRVLSETHKQVDVPDNQQVITRVLVHDPNKKYELFNF